jgi:hypothetical protein
MDVHQFSHLSLTFCRSFLQVWHLGVLGFIKTKSIVSTLRTSRSEAASPMLSEPGEHLARSVEWNAMAALKLLHRASSVERRDQAIGNICFDFEPQRRATKLSCGKAGEAESASWKHFSTSRNAALGAEQPRPIIAGLLLIYIQPKSHLLHIISLEKCDSSIKK